MKATQISLAIAAALVAGQAAALTPATTPQVTLYVSGASAPTKNFYKAMTSLCQAGSIHVYTGSSTAIIPGDSGSGNFFAYFCKFQNTGSYPTVDNKNVLVYHSVDGGSFNSIGPTLDTSGAVQFPINFLKDITATATSGCSAGTTNNADGLPTYTGCGNATRARPATGVGASDGGLADVEPPIFADLLSTLDAADKHLPDLNSVGIGIGQTFGVVASDSLYQAMQTKQIASGELSASCVAGDFTPGTCQPNINAQEYAGIAAVAGGNHTDWQFLVGAAGAGKNVNLCRRVSTSGTQASSNVYFLHNPCGRADPFNGQVTPAAAANGTANFIVTEGSSTGNVKTCLNNANAAGNFAIGVVSAENTVGASDHWHFLKVNNVSPNLDAKQRQTTIDGKYDFTFETTLNWITDGGVKDDFFNQLAAALVNPLDTATDLTGLYISPASGYLNSDYPTRVSKGTRFGNSCAPIQQ